MCGLSGAFSLSKKLNIDMMSKLANDINHRGPDHRSSYNNVNCVLNHNRLKILDLTEKGNQPFVSNNQNIISISNCEIYNHLELKYELVKKGFYFNSNSDAEIFSNGWVAWGHELFKKINGMFAVVIFDKQKKQIILSRDRIGIKPLFYAFKDDTLYFCSEPLPLAKCLNEKINPKCVIEYLHFQNYIQDGTIFRNVKSLDPGQVLFSNNGSFQTKKFFLLQEFILKKNEDITFTDFDNELNKTIKSQIQSDVPICSYLSSGIDSSIVTSKLLKYANPKTFETFTAYYPDNTNYDESSEAEKFAQIHNVKNNKVKIDFKIFKENFESFFKDLQMPRMGYGAFSQYIISKEISKKNFKVAFSGHGGDELFCGYSFMKVINILNKKKYHKLYKLGLKELGLMFKFLYDQKFLKYTMPILFNKNEFSNKIEYLSIIDEIKYKLEIRSKKIHLLKDRYQYDLFHDYLPGLLSVEDILSMRFAVETRVPILDNNILNFKPFKNDEEFYELKPILKKILRKILNEKNIKKDLTKKIGFSTPMNIWLAKLGKSYLEDQILNSKLCKEFIKTENLKELINSFMSSNVSKIVPYHYYISHKIWQLISLAKIEQNKFSI